MIREELIEIAGQYVVLRGFKEDLADAILAKIQEKLSVEYPCTCMNGLNVQKY